jgi:hypothetical protein
MIRVLSGMLLQWLLSLLLLGYEQLTNWQLLLS